MRLNDLEEKLVHLYTFQTLSFTPMTIKLTMTVLLTMTCT